MCSKIVAFRSRGLGKAHLFWGRTFTEQRLNGRGSSAVLASKRPAVGALNNRRAETCRIELGWLPWLCDLSCQLQRCRRFLSNGMMCCPYGVDPETSTMWSSARLARHLSSGFRRRHVSTASADGSLTLGRLNLAGLRLVHAHDAN